MRFGRRQKGEKNQNDIIKRFGRHQKMRINNTITISPGVYANTNFQGITLHPNVVLADFKKQIPEHNMQYAV